MIALMIAAVLQAGAGKTFDSVVPLEFRTNTINGLFAVNRRAGALWALAEEPGVAHVIGRSKEMGMIFFEDVLELKSISEKAGYIGDLKAKTFQAAESAPTPNAPTAWLPTERVARAWQSLVTAKPFAP